MKLNLMVLLLAGFLLNACGDKMVSSSGRKIFAVRGLEGDESSNENLQVALLDANQIHSEEDAREAVQNAQWVSIDEFSDNNIVFREQDEQAPDLSDLTYARYQYNHYNHRRRHCDYVQSRRHRHRRGCWRPYSRGHWVNRRPPIYRGCRRGYLFHRGRCVLPYTPVYDYWWTPRHTYQTRIRVSWSYGRRNRHRHYRSHRSRRGYHNRPFRVSLYF